MHVFDKLIPFLSERLQRPGSAVLVGSHERIPIKRELFRQLAPITSSLLVFVDGGNGEIVKGPNVSVQFVRLYATWYEHGVRVSRELREMYVAVLAFQKGLDLGFEATVFSNEGAEMQKFSFDAYDPALSFAGRRAEPSAVANHVRKLLEFRFADEICSKMPSGILVRDGDLDARGEVMEESFRQLRVTALRKSVVVLGLSKTSTLCTDSGNSALAVLGGLAPAGAWYYYAGGNVAFVKLHPGSRYVFRCDVFPHDREKLPGALSALAANAADPSLLGYPYGLIDADKFAQVTKDETEQLRARFAVKSRELFRSIEAAVNAHDVLNSF
ncbi:MAG: hypothetical protein QW165_01650 [Candidatus Woesearchaeota archaeon]